MKSNANNTKILLVSDNKDNVANIKLRLEESIRIPCSVWHCLTLAESVDYLDKKKLRPNVIILDLGLVGTTDPKEIYQKMGQSARDIPIIALTGTGNDEHNLATFVMEAGAADHMIRGQFGRLIDAIEFALIRRRITVAAAQKRRSDQKDRQEVRAQEAIEAEKMHDEKHLQKDQYISWMSGGYSVEENIEDVSDQDKIT